jgi:polyisoprenyl-phosphate glycosyltransferase
MAIEVSVVVPVYRNEATLRELHARLTTVLKSCTSDYEIIFVDDCSPDGSRAVLRDLATHDRHVICVTLKANQGQNQAVLVGLAHAAGAVAIVMDADLQDPPEAIPRLLAALKPPLGAVFAGRRGRYEGRMRLATSWLFKHILHLRSGGRLPHDAGLFVAMRRELIDRLLALRANNPYVLRLLASCRMPMISLPVERAPRAEGESAYTHRMRLRLAARALFGPSRQKSNGPLEVVRPAALALVAEIDEGRRRGEPA